MKKQKFTYHFTPAAITSNFVPLVVIVYVKKDTVLVDFEYKMWNTLQVSCVDKTQEELLKELIIEYSESCECEEYVFGYGDIKSLKIAISEGVISLKNTVYADMSEHRDTEKLKQTLNQFEKMVPEL